MADETTSRCVLCSPVCLCSDCGGPAMHLSILGDVLSTGRCPRCHARRGAQADEWSERRQRAEDRKRQEVTQARELELREQEQRATARRRFE